MFFILVSLLLTSSKLSKDEFQMSNAANFNVSRKRRQIKQLFPECVPNKVHFVLNVPTWYRENKTHSPISWMLVLKPAMSVAGMLGRFMFYLGDICEVKSAYSWKQDKRCMWLRLPGDVYTLQHNRSWEIHLKCRGGCL